MNKLPSIGSKVVYEKKVYNVLGYAASKDEDKNNLIEIAWNDYELSPTGYLAVAVSLLEQSQGEQK